MNILGIDIGNTHTEIGILSPESVIDSFRVSTILHKTEDEFWYYVDHFLSRNSLSPLNINSVIVSSVVPGLNFVFQKMIEKYFHKTPVFVTSSLDVGLKIHYKNPAQVGADRLCNAVAAYEKYKDNCIVLDFGTATTFDVIFKEGSYEGGIIAAGLETTNWGLHAKADLLPRVRLEYPEDVIGKDTETAIQIGLIRGTIHLIDGLIDDIINSTGRQFKLIATGGLSRLVMPYLSHQMIYEPYLVLDGLRIIARRLIDHD